MCLLVLVFTVHGTCTCTVKSGRALLGRHGHGRVRHGIARPHEPHRFADVCTALSGTGHAHTTHEPHSM